jgi:hypothetical protein
MLKSMAQQLGKIECKVDTRLCQQTTTTPQKTTATQTKTQQAPAASSSDTIDMLSNLICSPMIEKMPQMADSLASMTGLAGPPKLTTPLKPIPMCPGMLSRFLRDRPAATGSSSGSSSGKSPRRFYRIDATGVVQRSATKNTQVHIRGIWDSQSQNSNPVCINHPSCFKNGTWMYFRLD